MSTHNTEPGYVYILTNPSFKEDWVKIGKSSRPVEVRSAELDNTAVPLPFEIYSTIKTIKFNEVERLIHKSIDRISDLRIRQNREFFNIAPATATDMLVDIANTLGDAEVCRYEDNIPYKIYPVQESVPQLSKLDEECASTERRGNFHFSMIGLQPGDMIVFDPIPGIRVKVVDDRTVEYENRLWKLSPFCTEFMPEEKQNNSGRYQGPLYFSYQGKTLHQMRLEKEQNDLDAAREEC